MISERWSSSFPSCRGDRPSTKGKSCAQGPAAASPSGWSRRACPAVHRMRRKAQRGKTNSPRSHTFTSRHIMRAEHRRVGRKAATEEDLRRAGRGSAPGTAQQQRTSRSAGGVHHFFCTTAARWPPARRPPPFLAGGRRRRAAPSNSTSFEEGTYGGSPRQAVFAVKFGRHQTQWPRPRTVQTAYNRSQQGNHTRSAIIPQQWR